MGLKQRVVHDKADQQVIVKSGVYTVTDRNETIVVNATAPVQIILPNATGIEGTNYIIARIDSTMNNVVVTGTDFQKINGADNYYINAQWSVITFSATDLSQNSFPAPGYFVKNIAPTPIVKEDFTSLIDFNREKMVFHTATTSFAYSASTRPKKHGLIVQHRVQSQNSAMATFPVSWFVTGEFKPNVVNYITFVALPDVTTESDIIQVTIRN